MAALGPAFTVPCTPPFPFPTAAAIGLLLLVVAAVDEVGLFFVLAVVRGGWCDEEASSVPMEFDIADFYAIE